MLVFLQHEDEIAATKSMSDSNFFESRFWQWHLAHEERDHTKQQALGVEALEILIDSISTGEITSFDGIQSPLSQKIKEHHHYADFEMNSNWIGSSQNWACPCCGRSKFEISRLGNKGQILAKLVVHHDHMSDALHAAFHEEFKNAGTNLEQKEGLRLVERIGGAFAAYEEVLICEDCNNADTEGKKIASTPSYFSFSITQIRSFISSQSHSQHRVNGEIAVKMWQQAKPAYDLRMSLIRTVATAAATDSHWYEPFPRRTPAIPVFGFALRAGDVAIRDWISTEKLFKALGPHRNLIDRNLSRWRTVSRKVGKTLPKNYLPMLRSEEAFANAWDRVPQDWQCPTCLRSKTEVVYVGDRGKINFYVRTVSRRGDWTGNEVICNHCASILASLRLELSALTGVETWNVYEYVSPKELAKIVIPRAHSHHQVEAKEAEALVLRLQHQLSPEQADT